MKRALIIAGCILFAPLTLIIVAIVFLAGGWAIVATAREEQTYQLSRGDVPAPFDTTSNSTSR